MKGVRNSMRSTTSPSLRALKPASAARVRTAFTARLHRGRMKGPPGGRGSGRPDSRPFGSALIRRVEKPEALYLVPEKLHPHRIVAEAGRKNPPPSRARRNPPPAPPGKPRCSRRLSGICTKSSRGICCRPGSSMTAASTRRSGGQSRGVRPLAEVTTNKGTSPAVRSSHRDSQAAGRDLGRRVKLLIGGNLIGRIQGAPGFAPRPLRPGKTPGRGLGSRPWPKWDKPKARCAFGPAIAWPGHGPRLRPPGRRPGPFPDCPGNLRMLPRPPSPRRRAGLCVQAICSQP